MFDESRYRAGTGGSSHQQGWTAAQPSRVSQRVREDRLVEGRHGEQVLVIGANSSSLAFVNALKASENGGIAARLLPLAWTPLGVYLGETPQDIAIPFADLYEWADRTFPPEDERAFVASMRDVELLARVGWTSAVPQRLEERNVLNVEDLPEEVLEALTRAPVALVQCASCRRLCVRDDFTWKEKQLCAWDYHGQVFGKRGPWREGAYEPRHFETIPACAYVVPELLAQLDIEVLLTVGTPAESVALHLVNAVLESGTRKPHMAVRISSGVTVLRER